MAAIVSFDPLPADIQRVLAGRADQLDAFARTPRFLASTGSTNDDASRLAAAGAHEGTWVLAEAQSAGRGRRGRAWASPPGAGLYLSVVFRPLAPLDAAAVSTPSPGHGGRATSLLTLMAGVAVASGIQAATGLTPALKWPNDVMIEGRAAAMTSRWRKLAGILAEASATGGTLQAIVLGIGVNLTPASYPPDVQARATSLEGELGRPVDRALVLVEILSALAAGRRQLLAGDDARILARWCALAPSSHGRRVRWLAGTAARQGVTRGIDMDGALLVETPDGLERIIAGEVEWE